MNVNFKHTIGIAGARSTVVERWTAVQVDVGSNPAQTEVAPSVLKS